ncbi:MAG: sulfite reductase flavoprotein subunit alpha, partial [Acidithiobacillus sp.]|nr:sulfite reductase flavoprotein subunit alpha [Acidithiobacillus sp.]
AVLGLGDRSFDTFCAHGRNIDQRLRELGATALCARLEAEFGEDAIIEQWQENLVEICQGTVVDSSSNSFTSRERHAKQVSRKNHPLAHLLQSKRLEHPEDARFLTHCVLDIRSADLCYQTGDLLQILPCNSITEVDALLDASGLDGEHAVRLNDEEMSLREALRAHLDIRRWGQRALQEMIPGETAQQFVERFRSLQPRRYSIASSASDEPDQIHLLVTGNRDNMGLCSGYLANLAPGASLRVAIQSNPKFHIPAEDLPIIMIAAGSGLAPFRGFLRERETRGDKGKNWLFFGDRYAAVGLPFAEEIRRWQKSRHLHRLDTAFSRDQKDPIYVQQRITEQGAAIWDWVQQGANLYLCGSLRMAKGVGEALQQIAQRYGGLSPDGGTAFWADLQRSGRLCKDVY